MGTATELGDGNETLGTDDTDNELEAVKANIHTHKSIPALG